MNACHATKLDPLGDYFLTQIFYHSPSSFLKIFVALEENGR